MLSMLNKPIYDKFLSLCSSSRKSIKLCAPFVKSDIVADILNVKLKNTRLELITNLNLKSLLKSSSDVEAIQKLINFGADVFTFSRLHAKFYIFDKESFIVTSANLTSSGLKRNYEYGIITDAPNLLELAVKDFDELCNNELTGKVELKHIETITKILNEIPPLPKFKVPVISNIFKDELDEIYDKDKRLIIKNLSGWKKYVFIEVDKLSENIFSTESFKYFIPNLKQKYPDNSNVEAKIRQQLQFLRDVGLIQFVSRGVYRKLWL